MDNIIAINRRSEKAFILDPIVCFERDSNQATEVALEEKNIYDSCIPCLSKKYHIAKHQWTVIDLLFGCRGVIRRLPKFTGQQLHSFKVSQETTMDLVIGILGDSLKILHHHLYYT